MGTPPDGAYLALIQPSANRVYAAGASEMLAAELEVFATHLLDGQISGITPVDVAGVEYLGFEASGLSSRDLAVLANLSAVYALFSAQEGLLRPHRLTRLDRFDDDLISILKYPGKTNEQFTKLLVNVTAAVLRAPDRWLEQANGRALRVLDPMSGRGTTLNQALLYGWHAVGIDLDKRDVEAYSAFFQRWLKTKRFKHHADTARLRRAGENLGRHLAVTFAATKEEHKAGRVQTLDVYQADTLRTADVLDPGSVDLIVTDAPYGVQHGATAGGGLARDPGGLIARALPGWRRVLRSGGALGLSWNRHVLEREELTGILTEAGFEVVEFIGVQGNPVSFAHRVDQSIDRDLIVARPQR